MLSRSKHSASFLARALVLAAVTAFGSTVSTSASADSYPDRPIKVITGWSDGFPANSTRLFAEALAQRLKQPVVVDVRSGAGGEVASRALLGLAADGYALMSTGSSITIRSVMDDKNVDGVRDLQPIGQITTTPYVIVAKTGKFGSFANLRAQALAAPGKFNFASAGVGTGMHYLGELLNDKAGIKLVHVPYPTGSRQLLAVNAGDVELAIISLVTALPHIQAGSLEALAVSTTRRAGALPNVPTLAESGVKGIPNLGAWMALFGPKNMPAEAVKVISEHVQAISRDPKIQATVAGWGADLPDSSIAALEETIKAEKASWATVIKH